MALSHSPKIVTDGLVLCLDAGDRKSYSGSGSTWTDRVNNTNQTLNGVPVFESNNGGGIIFDGTDDRLPVTFPTLPSSGGSIDVWMKKLDTTSNTFIFNHVASSTNRYYIRIDGTAMSVVRGNPLTALSLGNIDLNTYLHITMVWDSTTLYGYKNGVLIGSTTYTNPDTDTTNGNYGSAGSNNYGNFTLASSRIYNKTLTANEVLQNYQATRGRFGI